MNRRALLIGVTLLGGFVGWPGAAEAAFVITNGLDRKALRRRQVSVALVRVRSERVNSVRKRQGFVLHRWIDLQVVKLLHGTIPTGKGLRNVPYTPQINSAWPSVTGSLRGRYFIMAWIRGYPCGLGMTVSLGPRASLPVVASGPKDPRVDAVKRLLSVVRSTPPKRLVSALVRMFHKGGAVESRMADGALVKLHARHRTSYARYRRLVQLVKTGHGADSWLGWSVVYDLGRFPKIRGATDYWRWRKLGKTRRSRRGFRLFRKRVRTRLTRWARSAKNNVDIRAMVVWQLSRAPSYLGRTRDRGDRAVLATLRSLRTDPQRKVRRAARSAYAKLLRRRRSRSRRH